MFTDACGSRYPHGGKCCGTWGPTCSDTCCGCTFTVNCCSKCIFWPACLVCVCADTPGQFSCADLKGNTYFFVKVGGPKLHSFTCILRARCGQHLHAYTDTHTHTHTHTHVHAHSHTRHTPHPPFNPTTMMHTLITQVDGERGKWGFWAENECVSPKGDNLEVCCYCL